LKWESCYLKLDIFLHAHVNFGCSRALSAQTVGELIGVTTLVMIVLVE